MFRILVFSAIAMGFIGSAMADDKEAILREIPVASSITFEDFQRIAVSNVLPADIEDKSLCLKLMSIKTKDNDSAKAEFQYLDELIKPTVLTEEIYRPERVGGELVPKGPITFIHADRITDSSCEVDGSVARGTVSFEAPKFFRGKVGYKAKKSEGKWSITEFQLPAYEIRVVLDKDGVWRDAAVRD